MDIAVQLTWWAIKSEAVKQLCKVVPSLATILVIKNIADVSNGLHPSMAISQKAMDALKNVGRIPNPLQTGALVSTQASAHEMVKTAITKMQKQRCSVATIAPTQLLNVPGRANVFGKLELSNTQWVPGRNAFDALRSQLISSVGQVPRASDYINFTVSVDGKNVFNKPGSSSWGLNIDVGTAENTSLINAMHRLHQQRSDRLFMYRTLNAMGPAVSETQKIGTTIKPLIQNIESLLINMINDNPTLIQSGNLISELGAISQYCQHQMQMIEMMYAQKILSQIETSGLHRSCNQLNADAAKKLPSEPYIVHFTAEDKKNNVASIVGGLLGVAAVTAWHFKR